MQPYEAPMNRTPYILAAVGAGLTSLYWAALALLIGVAASTGSGSPIQAILPFILIGLYAYRGYQVFQGMPAAANALLWLHGIGAVVSVMRMMDTDVITMTLYGIKIGLHVFGAATAYWAMQASTKG
jgi:hypothetical protein